MTISDPVYASLAEAYDECERTVLAGPLNGEWANSGRRRWNAFGHERPFDGGTEIVKNPAIEQKRGNI